MPQNSTRKHTQPHAKHRVCLRILVPRGFSKVLVIMGPPKVRLRSAYWFLKREISNHTKTNHNSKIERKHTHTHTTKTNTHHHAKNKHNYKTTINNKTLGGPLGGPKVRLRTLRRTRRRTLRRTQNHENHIKPKRNSNPQADP